MIQTIIQIKLMIANVFLVRGERTVIVDSGARGSADRILRALSHHGIARETVSLILLTHAHGDHAGGAAHLRAALGVPVAVHAADAAMLQQGHAGRQIPIGWEAKMIGLFDASFPGLAADILIDEQTDLSAYGIEGQLLHTPGHSPGSMSLLLPNREAIIGDILRGGFLGGMISSGRPNHPYFLNDLKDRDILFNSTRRVLEAGPQRLYVGHGGPLTHAAASRWLEENARPH